MTSERRLLCIHGTRRSVKHKQTEHGMDSMCVVIKIKLGPFAVFGVSQVFGVDIFATLLHPKSPVWNSASDGVVLAVLLCCAESWPRGADSLQPATSAIVATCQWNFCENCWKSTKVKNKQLEISWWRSDTGNHLDSKYFTLHLRPELKILRCKRRFQTFSKVCQTHHMFETLTEKCCRQLSWFPRRIAPYCTLASALHFFLHFAFCVWMVGMPYPFHSTMSLCFSLQQSSSSL